MRGIKVSILGGNILWTCYRFDYSCGTRLARSGFGAWFHHISVTLLLLSSSMTLQVSILVIFYHCLCICLPVFLKHCNLAIAMQRCIDTCLSHAGIVAKRMQLRSHGQIWNPLPPHILQSQILFI